MDFFFLFSPRLLASGWDEDTTDKRRITLFSRREDEQKPLSGDDWIRKVADTGRTHERGFLLPK